MNNAMQRIHSKDSARAEARIFCIAPVLSNKHYVGIHRRDLHAQLRDSEDGVLHRSSATTPFTTCSIGSGPARLSAQTHPSAAPDGGYGAGGSWNAVIGGPPVTPDL